MLRSGVSGAQAGPERRRVAWPVVERVLAALVAGVVAALLVAGGALRGWPLLVLLVAGLLLVPVARDLPARVLLTGFFVLGWWPLTWWLPWRAPVGHVALGAALLAAGLAAAVAGGPGRRARARRLLPRARPVDALLAVVAGVVAALRWPWWGARSADSALGLLLAGWDHSAHFDITEMIRRHGTVMHWLGPAPLGDTWSYTRYPQGFHTLAATVVEALAGPTPGDPRTEVLRYVQALGVLDVVGAVVLAAALLALPWLRARAWLAAPAVALATSTLVLGPGAHLLQDGFPNFALGTVLLAGLAPLVVGSPRVPDPVRLAAVGGALVGIAHTWALLLVVALPTVLLLLVPWRPERWHASRRAWVVSVVVVVATAAAGFVAVVMVSGASLTDVLVIGGAITAPPLRWTAGLLALAGVGCLAAAVRAWRVRRDPGRPVSIGRGELARVAGLGLVVAVSAALAAWVAAVQLESGGLGYYFWKLTIAIGVAAATTAGLAGATLVLEWVPGPVGRRLALAGVAAGVVVTQGYGVTAPRTAVPAPVAAGPGWAVAQQARDIAAAVPGPAVARLWAAATDPAPEGRRLVVLGGDLSPTERISLGQWYNALTGRWTDEANELLFAVTAPTGTGAELAALAGGVLGDPATVLLVPPDQVDATRAAFGAASAADPALAGAAERIAGW